MITFPKRKLVFLCSCLLAVGDSPKERDSHLCFFISYKLYKLYKPYKLSLFFLFCRCCAFLVFADGQFDIVKDEELVFKRLSVFYI